MKYFPSSNSNSKVKCKKEKSLFFSQRRVLKFDDTPKAKNFFSSGKEIKVKRKFILPKINDIHKPSKANVNSHLVPKIFFPIDSNLDLKNKNSTFKVEGGEFLSK